MENKTVIKNQVHYPRRRKNQLDAEQESVKMRYKCGESTMLLCTLPLLQARTLAMNITAYLERNNSKLIGKFIYTK